MVHRAEIFLSTLTILVIGWAAAGPAAAQYDNYYVPPGSPAGVAAQMYPSPRPVPPLVGYTYVTYPPLLPQEFLYDHCDHYRRVNCDCSVTCTKIATTIGISAAATFRP